MSALSFYNVNYFNINKLNWIKYNCVSMNETINLLQIKHWWKSVLFYGYVTKGLILPTVNID